jgi:hypothetical protein
LMFFINQVSWFFYHLNHAFNVEYFISSLYLLTPDFHLTLFYSNYFKIWMFSHWVIVIVLCFSSLNIFPL